MGISLSETTFRLDDFSMLWDQVTELLRARSRDPIQKSRPARRLFYLSGAVAAESLRYCVTSGPIVICPRLAITLPLQRTENPAGKPCVY
jgi:hypothetical protein